MAMCVLLDTFGKKTNKQKKTNTSWSYPVFFYYLAVSTLHQRVLAYATAGLFSEYVELVPNLILSETMAPFPLLGQKI